MGYELWARTYGALGYGQKQRDPHKKIPELVRDDYIGISRRHVEGRRRETSSYFFIAIQDLTGSRSFEPKNCKVINYQQFYIVAGSSG